MSAPTTPPLSLHMRGISKHFGGVQALRNVSLEVVAGEVHALVGENGAGKSTLVKVLAGAHRPDSGEIQIGDAVYPWMTPRLAQTLGVAIIYQEFNLVPWMSVVDNLFLGREVTHRRGLLDRASMRAQGARLFERLGVAIDLEAEVNSLTVAQQQLVEIAKALAFEARVIVMDEPSAVLAGNELNRLFEAVRTLRRHGVAVVYISHRIAEVFGLADRITVLKDGAVVATRSAMDIDSDTLVSMMIGRNLEKAAHSREVELGPTLLGVTELQLWPGSPLLSFDIRAGEIVGVAGLVGSGRTSLARILAGVDRPVRGTIAVGGRRVELHSPSSAITSGIVLVPEDRKAQGLLLPLTLRRNVAMPALRKLTRLGFVRTRDEHALAATAVKDLDIRPPKPEASVESLSGGNQQKVVVAKWLGLHPKVVVLDEPTRGIDVGAKFEMYNIIRHLARNGAAILMISSELPEILAMSDRVLVMRDGALAGSVSREQATEEGIMRLAIGHGQGRSSASGAD